MLLRKDNMSLTYKLLHNPITRELKLSVKSILLKYKYSKNIRKGLKTMQPIIYYCGIPAHGNLGDLAQGVCIRRWLKKNYPEYHVTEIETDSLVNTKFSCLNKLKKAFNDEKDFVVFQSGYTTTDLGGFADLMHQAVIQALPNSRILMMPQTIFFQTDERKELCSKVYNSHTKMLFLARDNVSFEMAKEMFPDINKACYPDIVTTLIGTFESNHNREGIIFCLRNDTEKYYSDEELAVLENKCKAFASIDRTDTTKGRQVVKEAEKFIFSEIERYSKFKVMITDRYHGTILSLIAGTPVVIIKTTDHKVVTGADWFKGVYDDHVYLAKDLEEAYELAKKLYIREEYKTLKLYFENNYYDKLPAVFKEKVI